MKIQLKQFVYLVFTMIPLNAAVAEFDEAKVIIEINATDGDVGFHALFDAEAWKEVRMVDPDGHKIFDEKAFKTLRTQGLTENFFESAEPVCDPEDADEDEAAVSLEEFISRFPDGLYALYGKTNDSEHFSGEAELTYDLPAAPTIDDGVAFWAAGEEVVLSWSEGTTLGDKCHDADLVAYEIIDIATGEDIVGWEVVVEPEDDEGIEPLRVFSVQLPPGQTEVTVPWEFIETYLDNDVDEFKYEVGAIEASGNQTFSEATFCIVESEGGECAGDEES